MALSSLKHREELAQLISHESGKPLSEARGELDDGHCDHGGPYAPPPSTVQTAPFT
jgi:acyl-CoA reductase-like NAD-dependent aldehyde dehydrogenase